jgi:uncharacterized lipoprotein NlpE involved in copper resistance
MKLIALAIFAALMLAGCNNEADDPAGDGITASTQVITTIYLRTVRHDGHLFVTFSDKAVIHHPSCPCGGRP